MKVLVFADTHGRNLWEEIIEREGIENLDKVIFLGDYVDSYYEPLQVQIDNLNNILKFKNKYPDKVTLLLGNHDYHYFNTEYESQVYSGYQRQARKTFRDIFWNGLDLGLFQFCEIVDGIVYTHAGISEFWLEYCKNKLDLKFDPTNIYEVKDFINMVDYKWKIPQYLDLFEIRSSMGGEHPVESCIWVRPEALVSEMFKGVTQIVGHTHDKKMRTYYRKHMPNSNTKVICIDASEIDYHVVVEDGYIREVDDNKSQVLYL